MIPVEKIESLKSILRMTTRCYGGSESKALDKMMCAAPVVAVALKIEEADVLAFVDEVRGVVKLGSRVRVTRPCALIVGAVGDVTWLSDKEASVQVVASWTEHGGPHTSRVPLDALQVVP